MIELQGSAYDVYSFARETHALKLVMVRGSAQNTGDTNTNVKQS